MGATFLSQLKTVLWRNILLKRRNRCQFIQEIFVPLIYMGLFIMMRIIAKPSTEPAITFPAVSLNSFSINTTRPLIVVSNGLNISPVMTKISAQLGNVSYQVYSTKADADRAYSADKDNVTVGIIFGYPNTSLIQQYAIRLPRDKLPSMTGRYTPNQGQCRSVNNNYNGEGSFNCDANIYLTTGVAQLQIIIDQLLMEVC
ncbi:hypothetical protein ACOMHN_067798 [Nucella lapillus]